MRNYRSDLAALIAPHEHKTLTQITHHSPSPVITDSTIIPTDIYISVKSPSSCEKYYSSFTDEGVEVEKLSFFYHLLNGEDLSTCLTGYS